MSQALVTVEYLFSFLERGEKREKEGVRNIHVPSVASHTPTTGDLAGNPGLWPDGNQTSDLSICRPALNPLSHTTEGDCRVLKQIPQVKWEVKHL